MSSKPEKITDLEGMGERLGLGDRKFPERDPKVFTYRRPEKLERSRSFIPLVRSDIMMSMIQVINKGGEQELHSHAALDGFWFVLEGRAKFYGEGDKVIADLRRHEGIFIPRNFLYWFEAVGDEPLELLQVEAIDKSVRNNHYSPKPVQHKDCADIYNPDGTPIAKNLRME